jgi:putative transposase
VAISCQGIDCLPLEIGGVEDHVHLLIFIPADIAVAKVVSQLKANASKWMGKGFAWQRGYASFTVSASNLNSVRTYIATQPEHHKKRNFQQEYVALLKKHGVKYDERYIFD